MLCRPQADREHGEQVIQAADGVPEAGNQTIVAMAGVGEGQGRGQQQGEGAEDAFECHEEASLLKSRKNQAAVNRPWRSMNAMISSRPWPVF
ncbi:hypothetical protein SRABI112_03291 [Pseudomonas mediterranea]|nr:hypothetical protein SRABI112_03291 [Pseudomonas mediterranea]